MRRLHTAFVRKRSFLFAGAVLIAAGVGGYCYRLAAARAALAKTYSITEIAPPPGFQNSQGKAINARGQVVGRALTSRSPLKIHAFLWTSGQAVDLGVPPGFVRSAGIGLNAMGQIVGYGETAEPPSKVISGRYHELQSSDPSWTGFQSDHGKNTRLPLLPGCVKNDASGINDHGEIVGTASPKDSRFGQPFIFSRGKLTALGTLPAFSGHFSGSEASGINSLGQVVGTSTAYSFDIHFHAFLYDRGRMQDLGSLPGLPDSAGTAINDRGQVTGFAAKAGPAYDYDGLRRAFLWQDGAMKDLGTLPGFRDSLGTAINSQGDVVGYAESFRLLEAWLRSQLPFIHDSPLDPPRHAFLYHGGHINDLNDLIDPRAGWVLDTATGINDQGEIVGTGSHNGKTRAFVLRPAKL